MSNPNKKKFEDPRLLDLGTEPLGPEGTKILRSFMEGDLQEDEAEIRERMKTVFANVEPPRDADNKAE